jgi:MFS family permease
MPKDGGPTAEVEAPLYTRQFFEVLAAVILFMTGVALQFHFGEYMAHLGHDVSVLGHVLAAGLVGTLLLRPRIGEWIERWGCKRCWVFAALIVTFATAAMQFADTLWAIIVLRCVIAVASAVVMTTVAVFAAEVAPAHRRAESIGTIGLAGFIGMTIGPTVGDWIFWSAAPSLEMFRLFFSVSAACSLLSALAVAVVVIPPRLHEEDSGSIQKGSVIKTYWPGPILLVGVTFGMAFCIQSAFLERYAEHIGFRAIKTFFLVFGPTAILLRIVLRKTPQTLGRRRTLALGMACHAIGLLSLAHIQTGWQLAIPGVLMGTGHCFIFPSMVDLAAGWFPLRHRGTGTTLILGAVDTGLLTGYALFGPLFEAVGYRRGIECVAAIVVLTIVAVIADGRKARQSAVAT